MQEARDKAGSSLSPGAVDISKLSQFAGTKFNSWELGKDYVVRVLSSSPEIFDLSNVPDSYRAWAVQFLIKVLNEAFVTVEAGHFSEYTTFITELRRIIDSQA
jgi:hypothetical protein